MVKDTKGGSCYKTFVHPDMDERFVMIGRKVVISIGQPGDPTLMVLSDPKSFCEMALDRGFVETICSKSERECASGQLYALYLDLLSEVGIVT